MRRASNLAVIALALCVSVTFAQTPLGPAFTYQGQLKQNGQPFNGSANLVFRLFDSATGGNLLGTQTLNGVSVSNGLFTVTLNPNNEFGASAFNGQSRFLEIAANGTILTPRQALNITPDAGFSRAPWNTTGSDISYTTGSVSIGTNATTAGLQVKHEPISASGTLALEGITHSYMSFFPDGFAAGRKGFLGFPGPTINNIELANEIAGGGLALVPGTGGNVEIDGKIGIDLANPSATLHVNGNIGVGVANIPAGLTSELGGTNTPLLNLDVNFRETNHNTAFVGGALRIDSRSDAADPLFQFLSRAAGTSGEAMVAALTQNGRLSLGSPPESTVPGNLQIHDVTEPAITFRISGHSRTGLMEFNDHLVLINDIFNAGVDGAQLQDDGSWTQFSDRRLKTDITPAMGLLDKALTLRPVEFYMKDQDCTRDPYRKLGLIAQEVQPLLPSLVYGSDMLSMDYSRIGVVAIGAIQEQQAIITEQSGMIEAQRERIATLESRDAAMLAATESMRAALNAKDARMDDLAARLAKLESQVAATASGDSVSH